MKFPAQGLLVLLFLLIGGCAALQPQIERPRLELANIEVKELGLFQQRFLVTLRAQNPNAVALPIRGLTYALDLEGSEFASGATATPFTLPAYGETDVQLELSTSLMRTGQWLFDRLKKGGTTMDYRIRGDIDVARTGVGRIPFENTGQVDLRLDGAR
jgi:LEA14-like dessication related protein